MLTNTRSAERFRGISMAIMDDITRRAKAEPKW